MKITLAVLASSLLVSSSVVLAEKKNHVRKPGALFKDDQSYWNRLLQNTGMSTPPPTPSPPTPSPPTPSPPTSDGPCDVEVGISCSLEDDPDASCETIEEVTEFQCFGCRPVALCFTYTAAKCADDLPPGMSSCNDFLNGPEDLADITISNGEEQLVAGTYAVGDEICVTNDGEELPEELFIFINVGNSADMPMANQLSVIDSSCSDDSSLTLLRSYGALDLVHYINDCQGNNDCFVPIVFEFEGCNTGPIDSTITTFEATINGDTMSLIEDATDDELKLESGECFKTQDGLTADCCSGTSYEVSTSLVTEGDDGSICEDDSDDSLDKPVETPSPSSPPVDEPTPPPVAAPVEESEMPTVSADNCFVQIEVDCTPPDAPNDDDPYEDCDSVFAFQQECNDFVYSMGFRFNGGDCSQERNDQGPEVYNCNDFGAGVPVVEGEEALIVVRDIKGLGTDFFTGMVPVGGFFPIGVPGELLDSNVNVTIYDGEVAPENILQTMIIHTSCSEITFLKDRYGSTELLWFNNTAQGNVTCAVDFTFTFNVENVVDGFNAELLSLTSITNFDEPNQLINLTSEVTGVVLNPGEIVPFTFTATVDTSVRKRYTLFSTVQGESPDGFQCRAVDFTNFTAGNTDLAPFIAPVDPP